MPVRQSPGKLPASQADVGPVVGEAYVGDVGEHHQVVGDDPRLPQFRYGVQLAAGEDLVAELHVAVLLLPRSHPERQGLMNSSR